MDVIAHFGLRWIHGKLYARWQPLLPFMNLLIAVSFLHPILVGVHRHGLPFRIGWSAQPILALIAGVLILVRPKFLNFIVAVYLIVVGLIGLFHWL